MCEGMPQSAIVMFGLRRAGQFASIGSVMNHAKHHAAFRGRLRAGFSLAELLVVVGILALLLAIIAPPLRLARQQAQRTQCSAQLQQLGIALQHSFSDFGFYPAPDDGGAPIRYTWIDVLVQRRYLGTTDGRLRSAASGSGEEPTNAPAAAAPRDVVRLGYCPADEMPEPLNVARYPDLIYPPTGMRGGVDYSYGIGMPLASGGWAWRPTTPIDRQRSRRFRDYAEGASKRVLAGDGYASMLYNLSGQALESNIWNDPTQYDNTVAWSRHFSTTGTQFGANLLFQDGHAGPVKYDTTREERVNTMTACLWRPGESLNTNPNDHIGDQWYPNQLPPSYQSFPQGDVFPNELLAYWYTETNHWTAISHK